MILFELFKIEEHDVFKVSCRSGTPTVIVSGTVKVRALPIEAGVTAAYVTQNAVHCIDGVIVYT